MSFYLSPGVYVRERDISDLIPSLATSPAALVGYSPKGNVDDIVLVTTPQQFIDEYGEPTPGQYFHYSALAYLEKGNKLYCFRAHRNALYGGIKVMESGTGDNEALSVGSTTKTFQTVSGEDILFYIFGKDPGVWNNSISIVIENIDAVEHTFDIVVYSKDADGNYTKMETWTVSRQSKLDGYGRQLYLEDRINGYSSYIAVADNDNAADTVMPQPQATKLDLAAGSDGSAVTDTEIVTGWEKFANPDEVDVRLLINGGYTSSAVQTEIKTLAEARKDCIGILDIPYAQLTSVSGMVSWRQGVDHNFNTSYTALYTPWVQIYDSYSDRIIDVPPSGYVAAQIAYTDYISDPWYAPAGFNRGMLNILGLTNIFTQGERDVLYAAQINPLQTFRGEGSVIWGQKTEQVKGSALDRVNVRRLMITLEKAIAVSLRSYAFEPNNELTRFRVSAVIEQYLDTLSARGAFQTELGDKGFRVVCDTTNNTAAVIDANELHVDVFLKPSKSAEFIQLQAIITTTGASFEELIARGVLF